MLDQGTFMVNTGLCTTLVLLLMVNNAMYIEAESVSLMKVPDPAWSWTSTGPSGVTQWEKTYKDGVSSNPIQYYNCDDRKLSSAPDTWLRSDVISAGVANRIDITIEYSLSNCSVITNFLYCHEDLDLYLHKSSNGYSTRRAVKIPDPYTSGNVYEKIGTLSPKVFSETVNAKAENKETHSFVIKKTMPYVVLAFQYQGGCISLHSVGVDYYRCTQKALSASLVDLPRTVSPANGSLQVKGLCAQNTKPLTNASDLYGFCKADGEWSTDMYHGQCGCDVGYGKVSSGGSGAECKVCPSGTFKDTISNTGCTTCPLNSAQDIHRTSCTCANGYYRTDKETKFDSCTAQPSAPQSLVRTFLNATCVTITWSAPSNLGGRTDLYYEAQCKRCNEKGTECTKSCTADISLHGDSRIAIFKHLSAYTFYEFKVLAKNGVSREAQKNGENSNSGDLVLRTNDAIPGIPRVTVKPLSSTSVFIAWTVPDKNGVILYFHVTYYPDGQRSNAKVFNTTFTNATITGLKEGKEYVFEVRASSRLGLGRPSTSEKIKLKRPTEGKKNQSIPREVMLGIFGALAFIVLIGIIVCVCICKRKGRRRQADDKLLSPGWMRLEGERMYIDPSNYGTPMEALMSNAEEIDRQRIKLEKNIGGGEFAEVFRGSLQNGTETEHVAVKILKPNSSAKNRDDFMMEASIMGQFHHPNVIGLKGVVTCSPDTPMMIVTEFMENGSLDHFLKKRDGQLAVLQLIGIGRGVADGMAYLSGINFIHRDLAARNILVADNMAAKVADFGLSRELDDSANNPESEYTTQGGKIPVRWTAPEAIRYRKFSPASDVWSFGILIWEIMSFGERPYWEWDNFQVMDRVDTGYRLPAPMNCPKVIHNLMLDCWDKEKNNRPKFADIVPRMDELIRSPETLRDDYIASRFASAGAQTNFGEITSVQEWLDGLNMSRYEEQFNKAGVKDIDQVKTMKDEDLAKIGITLIGHRNKLNKSVKAMNKYFEMNEKKDVKR